MISPPDRLTPAIEALRTLLPSPADHDRVYRALCHAMVGRPVEWHALSADDWQLLLDMAKSQRIVVRTQRALSGVADVPPVVRAGLRASAQMLVAANLALRHEFLRRILPTLRAAGIEPLALKGLAMALAWYDAPQDRQMDDLDLLVPAEQVEAAAAALAAIGYERQINAAGGQEHHIELIGRGPVRLIEIHRSLGGHRTVSDRDVLQWYLGRTTVVPVSLAGAAPLELHVQDGSGALLFQTAHLLLQHGDGESRINWYLDLHLIVESGRVDWDAVLQRVDELGWGSVLLQALEGLQSRFGTRVDRAVLERLAAAATNESVQQLLQRKETPLAGVLDYELRRLKDRSWPQRLRLAVGLMFPSPAYMYQRYQLTASRQLPVAYLRRWILALGDLRDLLLRGRGRRRTH